ncbi:MAG: hypothetical protein GXO36_05285 [Chloroflexi bacterium]|nr:hypothetical protein [Chloroflexota bacterium]
MSAPDAQGYVSIYYEVEPLAVVFIEKIWQVDLPLKYTHGYSYEKLVQP